MLVAALAGGAYLFFDQSVQAVQASDPGVLKAEKVLDAVPVAGRPAVALVLGYDKRFGEGGYGRSDTIILVRADPVTDALSMLSFPRDLMVDIYCPNQAPFNGQDQRRVRDLQRPGTVATLKNLTGVDINYLITVNFRGFRQVVNRMDGVWVDVDHRYFNRNDGTLENNYAAINLSPGTSACAASRHSITSATGTRTPTSTATRGSRRS